MCTRYGRGAGFGWFSNHLLELIGPFVRTGLPSMMPLVSLLAELRVFGSSAGGNVYDATVRAREVTRHNVGKAVGAAGAMGLNVQGGDPDRLAAFFSVRVDDGPRIVSALADQGVFVDFRDDEPGSAHGVVRLSTSAASFAYELLYATERLASTR